jgi:hypothetical protein
MDIKEDKIVISKSELSSMHLLLLDKIEEAARKNANLLYEIEKMKTQLNKKGLLLLPDYHYSKLN